MAGIKNIRDLYKKVGEKAFREILKKETRITEKFNARRFSVEKHAGDSKFYFYGKNGKTPLDKIDRTVNNLYEEAIQYIENLPKEIKSGIPARHRFGFSWFATNESQYERQPQHGLVLTDITIRNKDSETQRSIKEQVVMERWAKLFQCEYNKPLFEGFFGDAEIEALVEIAKGGEQINESLFPTKGLLNISNQNIEAIIFEQEDLLFKLTNVVQEESKTGRSHLFDLLLLDICEHINNVNLRSLKHAAGDSDVAYINIVSELFNKFVIYKGEDFLASGIEKPAFLEKSGSFNPNWITNKETISLIESNEKYEYLLTIFLTNLRKPKYPSGLLSENVVKRFNDKIAELDNLTADGYSHLVFNFILNEQSEEDEERETTVGPKVDKTLPSKTNTATKTEGSDTSIEKALLILDSFFNSDRHFSTKEPITVVLANASVVTNKFLAKVEAIVEYTGTRVMLFHDMSSDPLRVESQDVNSYLHAITTKRSDIFIGYHVIQTPTISKILNKCGSFIPTHIYCNEKQIEVSNMESTSIWAANGKDCPKWSIELISATLSKPALVALELDAVSQFKQTTPEELHAYWYLLKNKFDIHFYI